MSLTNESEIPFLNLIIYFFYRVELYNLVLILAHTGTLLGKSKLSSDIFLQTRFYSTLFFLYLSIILPLPDVLSCLCRALLLLYLHSVEGVDAHIHENTVQYRHRYVLNK